MRIFNYRIRKCTILLLFALTILLFYYCQFQPKRIFETSTRKLPNALIIGAQKCGTGTFKTFIDKHPSVEACGYETSFFNKDISYMKGVEWYRSQMPLTNENQITLEKTPDYFPNGKSPERVYALNPEMKLIVIVCDPVRRAVSSYMHQKSDFLKYGSCWDHQLEMLFLNNKNNLNNDSEIFKTFVNQELFKNSSIFSNGLYNEHVQSWLKYFPKNQMLFLNGGRFKVEPWVEMEKLQSFLNVEPLIRRDHFVFSQTKGFYCLRHPTTNQVECMGKNKGRKHSEIDAVVLNDLRELYRLENLRFFQFLNEEMTPWWQI